MRSVDLVILGVYLLGTVAVGAFFARSQRSVKDYFVAGGRLPWWAIAGSIVATETSTVTFISVPAFAFGADFTFMQFVIGSMIGRVLVVVLFVPWYFRGQLLTVYQLLGQRFGEGVRRLASVLFLATRTVADGFRLFATGLVLAALFLAMPGMTAWAEAWFPSADPTWTLLVLSVLVVGVATIAYTFLGGIEAVIWTDVIQLAVYLAGALVAAWLLLRGIPGGWSEIRAVAEAQGKWRWWDVGFAWDRSHTLWSGVIGGAFLTTATHGTDQMMVQRYLCGRSAGEARAALLASGVLVFAQFLLFLVIGSMLFVYYTFHAPGEAAAFTMDGKVQGDRVFPHFIVTHLPTGIVGLVLAAVFSAAMSTLSSSLNSSAATAVGDFYLPLTRQQRSDRHYLWTARLLTVVWGVLQIGTALLAIRLSKRLVDEVLGIASFTSGLLLGLFFLGTFTTRVRSAAAVVGLLAGLGVMIGAKLGAGISWQWYVVIGSLTTFLVGAAAQAALGLGRPSDPTASNPDP